MALFPPLSSRTNKVAAKISAGGAGSEGWENRLSQIVNLRNYNMLMCKSEELQLCKIAGECAKRSKCQKGNITKAGVLICKIPKLQTADLSKMKDCQGQGANLQNGEISEPLSCPNFELAFFSFFFFGRRFAPAIWQPF